MRRAVLERDGWTCQARGLEGVGRCWGPLEVDEVKSRARGGDPLDVDACQTLCRYHNQWKEDHPAEAIRLGLAKSAWSA